MTVTVAEIRPIRRGPTPGCRGVHRRPDRPRQAGAVARRSPTVTAGSSPPRVVMPAGMVTGSASPRSFRTVMVVLGGRWRSSRRSHGRAHGERFGDDRGRSGVRLHRRRRGRRSSCSCAPRSRPRISHLITARTSPPLLRPANPSGAFPMKQGYRIIDTDTHVGPSVETLSRVTPAPRCAPAGTNWSSTAWRSTDGGHHLSISPFPYRRRLRQATVLARSRAGRQSPLKGSVQP